MIVWLRDIRKDAEMTQKKVSKLIGVSRPVYTRIENGSRKPSVEIAKKIARVLEFNWTRFYEDK